MKQSQLGAMVDDVRVTTEIANGSRSHRMDVRRQGFYWVIRDREVRKGICVKDGMDSFRLKIV